ncbi:DUF2407 ubiquitin-like domain-containing protein [Auriculariales sp. MPI-PUGE-AT-0066]|nr:DUF2407 ubiquitin-like domain-containing protein [Auriculariales sp. MPI-PUGE-AT-0066]
MLPLSEKARGKQRAVDLNNNEATVPLAAINQRDVLIRFSEGAHDLLLPIANADTVKDLKAVIRQQRPLLERRRLRIIHSGRLLTDATHVMEFIKTLEERARAVHDNQPEHLEWPLVETKPPSPSPPTDAKGKGKATSQVPLVWLHCSVGARLEPHEEDDGVLQQTEQTRALRGFDRLAAAGLSEEEINNLRRQFHAGTTPADGAGSLLNEEEAEDQARTLEERWIDSLDNGTNSPQPSSDTATLAQGLLMGFFFPLLPFFFMSERRPAAFWSDNRVVARMGSIVFTRRMQMAIVLGFIMNLGFGAWRYLSS